MTKKNAGRPKKPVSAKRSVRYCVRLTREEAHTVKLAADARRVTVTDLMREVLHLT